MKDKFRSILLWGGLIILLMSAACSSGAPSMQNGGESGGGAPNAGGIETGGQETQNEREPLKTVRFSEVIRSIFYAPHYVAMEKGFYEAEGIQVDMVTAQGSDKGAAALLAGTADISLIGPETTIYIFNQQGQQRLKVFYQLTHTDGSFLLARERTDAFEWGDLSGKSVVGWRPGSAPQMVLNSVLIAHGVGDAEVITNIAAPAMVGAFTSGRGDYIQVYEPIASQLDSEGAAQLVASLGEAIGRFPETSFVATEQFIGNNPDVIEKWVNALVKATQWMNESSMEEVAKALAPYFEGTSEELIIKSVERYQQIGSWSNEPVLTQEQLDILQRVLIENGVLKEDQKVQLEDIADNSFAGKVSP